jgi:hypothetical protein
MESAATAVCIVAVAIGSSSGGHAPPRDGHEDRVSRTSLRPAPAMPQSRLAQSAYLTGVEVDDSGQDTGDPDATDSATLVGVDVRHPAEGCRWRTGRCQEDREFLRVEIGNSPLGCVSNPPLRACARRVGPRCRAGSVGGAAGAVARAGFVAGGGAAVPECVVDGRGGGVAVGGDEQLDGVQRAGADLNFFA